MPSMDKTKMRNPFFAIVSGIEAAARASLRNCPPRNRSPRTRLRINRMKPDRIPLHSAATSISTFGKQNAVPLRENGMPVAPKSADANAAEPLCSHAVRRDNMGSGNGTIRSSRRSADVFRNNPMP